jgi:hypothetical protein
MQFMSEDVSIPENLRDAFYFAVLNIPRYWTGGDPDPEVVSFDRKLFTPGAISEFVTKFADLMPRYIHDALRDLGYAETDLSYAAGARFVIGLIENRKRLQQWVRPVRIEQHRGFPVTLTEGRPRVPAACAERSHPRRQGRHLLHRRRSARPVLAWPRRPRQRWPHRGQPQIAKAGFQRETDCMAG